MKVLIIGSGGREHAIGAKVLQSARQTLLYFAPGNGGTQEIGTNVAIAADDIEALKEFALSEKIDLTIVGPELPLIHGVVDAFRAAGLRIFGADRAGAQLEGSKAFAKAFMKRYDIPTAAYERFTDAQQAIAYLKDATYPTVIKADGLAAGKGVIICSSFDEAERAIREILTDQLYGAQSSVVIEEFLEGKEISLLCFTDSKTIRPMASASDYKRAYDNDQGPNTGGMGCISPSPYYEEGSCDFIAERTLKGIQAEGFDVRGVVYIGLMLTKDGPRVLEYNMRFGDPETEVLLPRLESDFVELIEHVVGQTLAEAETRWSCFPAITVIMAAEGYPEAPVKGSVLSIPIAPEDVQVFHAGTKLEGDRILANGGRVLAITALGQTLEQARGIAYRYIEKIEFPQSFYRRDIGKIMQKIYEGKTKDVYQLSDGNVQLLFKDDVTGKDGVFDPGENQVGLTIKDNGYYGLLMSKLMFEKIEAEGIPTHYVSANPEERTMVVRPVKLFGKGIEVICRLKATGSFMRRFGEYCKEGTVLDYFVEVTLKDDAKGDPIITAELLERFGILEQGEYARLAEMTVGIAKILEREIAAKGLELIDLKLEYGKGADGTLMLVDEVSGGNMRVYDANGKSVAPIELSKILLGL